MFGQKDYKRLFAYSSVENMGVVAVGIGVGGVATYGALLHAMCHSLCKAGLFFLAGNVLRSFGSTTAADVRGVFGRLPVTGALLAVLFLALGGSPPFGPFVSELLIFRATLDRSLWLGVLFVTLLALAFLGMASVLFPMLHGQAQPGDRTRGDAPLTILTPVMTAVGALVLGVHVPPFLKDILRHAAQSVGG
jgi:hydrogenase-4 component F